MAAADEVNFSDQRENFAKNADFSKDDVNNIEEDFLSEVSGNPVSLAIAFFTFFILLFTIYFLFLRKKVSKGHNVLLVGPTNSGKTVLFGKLVTGKTLETFVSMKENQGVLKIVSQKSNRNVRVVDIPGHESIRLKFIDLFKHSAGALAFTLDASTFQKDLKDTAELLYLLLTDDTILSYKLPILIVCNKQDLISAKSSTLIKMALEKELTQLRSSHEAALDGIDGSRSKNTLGSGVKFTFDDLSTNQIEFVELDGKASDVGLEKIKEWIDRVV